MKNEIEQHGIGKSILLHLFPGFILTLLYIIFAPLAVKCGIPGFMVILIGGLLFIIPFELGYLFYEAKRKNRSFYLKNIIVYKEPLKIWQYFIFTLILLIWVILASLILIRPLDQFIFKSFFSWIPDMYLINSFADQADLYSKSILVFIGIFGIIVNGILGPIVEELYFRGYLLPRISRLGAWAPMINTILFSVYHFFTPWQNLSRIVSLTPLFYTVWWKKNLYIGIFVHCLMNIIGSVMLIIYIMNSG